MGTYLRENSKKGINFDISSTLFLGCVSQSFVQASVLSQPASAAPTLGIKPQANFTHLILPQENSLLPRNVWNNTSNWAPSSEFVSSSIPSWQILTAHAQPFRGARDLTFCLKVPLDSLLVWASSEGSGETARMRRLAWTFAARIGDNYQIRLARPNCIWLQIHQTRLE